MEGEEGLSEKHKCPYKCLCICKNLNTSTLVFSIETGQSPHVKFPKISQMSQPTGSGARSKSCKDRGVFLVLRNTGNDN